MSFFAETKKNVTCEKKDLTEEQKRIEALEKENSSLRSIVNDLMDRINKLQNRKNSNNSSIPPSKDENRPRKTKSLRKASGKKPGDQKGYKGSTLQMTATPDKLIEHKPVGCSQCGFSFGIEQMELRAKRQIIDLPPIIPEYTEHQVYSAKYNCGQVTRSEFPSEVSSPISYGPNTEALIAYLHSRQYLPSERMQELLHDTYGLPISEGSIFNILGRFVQKSELAYKAIKMRIETSKVVGSDETGIYVNGEHHWGWTWQNDQATYITISPNRGGQTIRDTFENGIPGAVLVHDCWKPHFKTGAINHQLCIAHLLRELNYFEARFSHPWATDFKELLMGSLKLKKEIYRVQYFYPLKERDEIEKRLHIMLEQELPPGMKDVQTFQNRMCRYQDYLFTFLYYPDVPPNNNASERAIRNIKVKQKISGQFKSLFGANCFAMIRSITDTCLKNNQNILNALKLIAQSKPE